MEKKIFRYAKFYYLGPVLIMGVLGSIFFPIFFDALNSDGYIYRFITALPVLFILYGTYSSWRRVGITIELTEGGLTFKIPFKEYNFYWDEISEFGRVRMVAPYRGGMWTYYIKSEKFGNKRFYLGSVVLSEIDKLCLLIFEKAKQAKFITLEDKSAIPFIKRYKAVEWRRKKEDKESGW